MSKKPFERPELTRELVDYYISESRRMQSEAICGMVKRCFYFIYSTSKSGLQSLGRQATTMALRLKGRHTFHAPRHAGQ